MPDPSPSELITAHIADLAGWRGERLAQLRALIHRAAPDITEEWKWGSPVYTRNGLVISTGSFKDHVKLNFFKGAQLAAHQDLFNNGLESKKSRAIDFFEGDPLDEPVLLEVIRAAVALNS